MAMGNWCLCNSVSCLTPIPPGRITIPAPISRPTTWISAIARNGLYKATGSATCWTPGQIDNLAYTYNTSSNRLQKIADTAPTGGALNPQRNAGFNPGAASGTAAYAYDANGNMNSDPYKALSIAYNDLNLPTQFNFGAGKTIDILYDYAGKKLRKTVKPSASATDYTQDYANGLEYRTTGSGGTLTLEAIYHDEGRITPNGANYQYEYSIKDHLGNTRLTFVDLNANNIVDVPGDILQENHYYPFGMNQNYGWMNNTGLVDSRYQYNGKELNDDYGLNLSDYGARWYDAAVGRWWSGDPMAEKYKKWSLFNYGADNPVRFIDPDGMEIVVSITDSATKSEIQVTYREGKFYYKDTKEEYTESNIFLDDVKSSFQYLSKSGTGAEIISQIEKSTEMNVQITEIAHMEIGNDNGKIEWNPISGNQFKIGEEWQEQSPALGLLHEIGHTYFDKNKEKLGGGDSDDWIINNIEKPVANDLGEGAREEHAQGQSYATLGPTSRDRETKASRSERKGKKKEEKKKN